jgi:hypothetical protein
MNKSGLLKDVFTIITTLAIWFYEWELLLGLFVDLWWLFSDYWLIFWIRVILTALLIVVWIYLRFRPEKEKTIARRKIP